MKHIAILISPQGEEWFAAYGPMTKERAKATEYVSKEVAEKAGNGYFGRCGTAFWESERKAEQIALKEYKGWTSKTQPV